MLVDLSGLSRVLHRAGQLLGGGFGVAAAICGMALGGCGGASAGTARVTAADTTPTAVPSSEPAATVGEHAPHEDVARRSREFVAPQSAPALAGPAEAPMTLPPEAKEKMVRLCETELTGDAGTACEVLSSCYGKGILGFPEDAEKAESLWNRSRMQFVTSCKAGEIASCSHLGQMNAMKLRTLDPQSNKAAIWAGATIPWLMRACLAGDRSSCEALSEIYQVGRGVPRDPARGAAALTGNPTPL